MATERVLVTIPPLKYLVESIGGDAVDVETLIPQGANPHTFEPTPKEVVRASEAVIWFRMGEPSEERVVRTLSNIDIVDMREGLPLLKGCCHHEGQDLHFWMSPALLRRMSIHIAGALARKFPDQRKVFLKNLPELLREIDQLNYELVEMLKPFRGEMLIVSHGAFGYFCLEFGFEQVPLEFEGKEPSPRQLIELVQMAKRRRVRRVIIQEQFNPKGAKAVAKRLKVKTCSCDPLEEDVLNNLRRLGMCIGEK